MADLPAADTTSALLSEPKQRLLEQWLRGSVPTMRARGGMRETVDDSAMSHAQRGVWFLEQLRPGTPAHNIPIAARATGPLSVEALQHAIAVLAARHDALRATFTAEHGRPRRAEIKGLVPVVERAHLGGPQISSGPDGLQRAVQAEIRRPFDLARGPLWRVTVISCGKDDQVIVITVHHIIADEWGVSVLVRELLEAYEARVQGRAAALHPVLQYSDFLAWESRADRERIVRQQLAYWRDKLAALPSLKLPLDRGRPESRSYDGGVVRFSLHEGLDGQASRLREEEAATQYMILLSAYATALSVWSGQSDFAVGAPVTRLPEAGMENVVGHFLNTVVLRMDLSGGPTFREVVRRVRATLLDALSNDEVEFDRLVSTLNPPRILSETPLFQVMLTAHDAPEPRTSVGDLRLSAIEASRGTSLVDLNIQIKGNECWAEYSSDVFDEETIKSFCELFAELYEAGLVTPDAPVSAGTGSIGAAVAVGVEPPSPCLTADVASAVKSAWAEVLTQPVIADDDNFFTLGGDEQTAIRVVGRISAATGAELDPAVLFEHPTVVELVAAIAGELAADSLGRAPIHAD